MAETLLIILNSDMVGFLVICHTLAHCTIKLLNWEKNLIFLRKKICF